jgi:hypothetical protein
MFAYPILARTNKGTYCTTTTTTTTTAAAAAIATLIVVDKRVY